MTEDRRTKAQLLEALATAEKRADDLKDREVYVPAAVARVPEADALASCVRALDPLNTNSGGYGDDSKRGAIERILHTLAAKYRVQTFTTEIRLEPCSRDHIDNIDPMYLADSIRGAVKRGALSPDWATR